MSGGIHLKRFYRVPREKVWFALTNREALASWFSPHDLEEDLDQLPVGTPMIFTSKPQGNWDGKMVCELLVLDKPNTLSYTFGGNTAQPTKVTWTLKEKDGGTLLLLDHEGFVGFQGFMFKFILRAGWKKMMKSEKFQGYIK